MMAVYTAETARANIRVRDGKRVFYLAAGDHLTPSAADWLRGDGVEILRGEAYRTEPGKPEHMTHLRSGVLVPKTDPRIAFRGQLDALQAEILLCGSGAGQRERADLKEILEVVRTIMRCDVLEEPFRRETICGMGEEELRVRSQEPQKYYGQPHFMPEQTDEPMLLRLNRLRTAVRETELAACRAIPDRTDLIRVLNRLSSLVWIMMIRLKKEETHGKQT